MTTRNEMLVRIANAADGDPIFERIAAALDGHGDTSSEPLLTATEACQFLRISRATLWRRYPPTLKIGSLPRWTRDALLRGGKS